MGICAPRRPAMFDACFVLQACVVKREFRKAEQLIKHAVFLAR